MKWFANLKISRKLTAGFSVIAIIATGIGIIGLVNIANMGDKFKHDYEANTSKMINLVHLAGQYEAERGALKEYYISNSSERPAVLEGIKASDALIDECVANLKVGVSQSSDEYAVITNYEKVFSEFRSFRDTVISLVDADKMADAKSLMTGSEATAVAENTKNATVEIVTYKIGAAQQQAESVITLADTLIIVMLIAIIIGIAVALVLSLTISRSISKPLRTMSWVAEMLAEGDVDVYDTLCDKDQQLKFRQDEIGKFALAFHNMINSTRAQAEATRAIALGDLTVEISARSEKDILGNSLCELCERLNIMASTIISAADQVATGSDLVSDSSMALSQGATEQASAIQQLTASIEGISSQTRRTAENAGMVDDISKSAKMDADGGNQRMKDMLAAMAGINESSGKIGNIIKVIDDIAFQTNILALNAAVEAARAGQHGRGFAVVAEEVRNLAARSANAAKETTALIENSVKKVETGTKIATETAEALSKIVMEVEKVAELVSKIAEDSQDQAVSIEQIKTGVSQVSQVVQTNAATAEESAAASEELSSQADHLKENIGIFKVKGNH